MTSENAGTNDNAGNDLRKELVPYLDGELEDAAASQVDELLLQDESLRGRLREYQKSWDMLDELPRIEAGEGFVRSTIETVATSTSRLVDQRRRRGSLSRWLVRAGLVVGAVAAMIAGYMFTSNLRQAPVRQLARDLPLLEKFDAYRHAESIEFLRTLADSDLFPVDEQSFPEGGVEDIDADP